MRTKGRGREQAGYARWGRGDAERLPCRCFFSVAAEELSFLRMCHPASGPIRPALGPLPSTQQDF